MKKRLALSLLLPLILTACGGGGSVGSTDASSNNTATTVASTTTTTQAQSTAQGVYQGTTSAGYSQYIVVLDNNELWSVYGNPSTAGLNIVGMWNASGTANNGSYSTTLLRQYDNGGSTITSGPASASYTAGASFNGSVALSTGGTNSTTQTVTFTDTAPVTGVTYNYNQAANLPGITGAWSMIMLNNTTPALTVASDGSFTATNGSCGFTGTFSPRASGKNVFDVVITQGPAPCQGAGRQLNGIAFDYILGNGKHGLLVSAVDSTKALNIVMYGSR